MILAAVVLFAPLLAACRAEWHADAGPWVIATQGEVWPLPLRRDVQNVYLHVSPIDFNFKVTGITCDILTLAVERYTNYLLRDADIADRTYTPEGRKSNLFAAGNLNFLEIVLENACETMPHVNMNESYSLKISEVSQSARLLAPSIWGILRGLETFSQLLVPSSNGTGLTIRCQSITDAPRLPHRGLLLDTSRHFFPVTDILLTLDAMSYNKLNVFHWHITDDNSFPYQSKVYPELSAKGAYHKSMVYSPGDVAEIIEYARLRGIRVMPEFDTPGHTRCWGIAYPNLLTTCYGKNGKPDGSLGPMNPINPDVYPFMTKLLQEIVEVFPDRYFHVGGDEVPFDCWASNPQIRSYMTSHGLGTNYSKLEEAYIHRILETMVTLNTSSIVWQEVFDNGVNLPSDTIVHVWKGNWQSEMADVTKAGYTALLSSCWYLDHIAGGGDWIKYYKCDPFDFPGSEDAKKLIMGGEACMWGEFVNRYNVHPRIWPRASAAAERLWSAQSESTAKAARRLEEHACRMNRRGVPAQPPNGPGFCVL